MPELAEVRHRFETAGQGQVFDHWASLRDAERALLLSDLDSIDLGLIADLRNASQNAAKVDANALSTMDEVARGVDLTRDQRAQSAGLDLLRRGKVAAFVVAGGQGTRLGHSGPKGTYPATPLTRKPLFQVFAEKILARSRQAGTSIPWLLMTSPENHQDTVQFFEANANFGLPSGDVHFFMQGTMPATDMEGRLILSEKHALFRSPDGHGGSLRALAHSGALKTLLKRGVEHLFYFQVDNPLVDICDPVFLGYHESTRSEFSSKAVPKRDASEKVGVFVSHAGRPMVIEYSDLPATLRDARDAEGRLVYRAGNIAVHVLSTLFVESLTGKKFSLPFHQAKKEIPCIGSDGKRMIIPGIKYETFVFDALPLASRTLLFSVPREDEFSPIKNKDGADSPATSALDQMKLHSRWLQSVGVKIPVRSDGAPLHRLEIGPLYADSAARLLDRKRELPLVVDGDLLLDAC